MTTRICIYLSLLIAALAYAVFAVLAAPFAVRLAVLAWLAL